MEVQDYNVDFNVSRERGHTVLHRERLLSVAACSDEQANTWYELGLTLSGELLSVDVASCWLGPFTFLFFLAPAPPVTFSPPTPRGELFCWNSFSWSAQESNKETYDLCITSFNLSKNSNKPGELLKGPILNSFQINSLNSWLII